MESLRVKEKLSRISGQCKTILISFSFGKDQNIPMNELGLNGRSHIKNQKLWRKNVDNSSTTAQSSAEESCVFVPVSRNLNEISEVHQLRPGGVFRARAGCPALYCDQKEHVRDFCYTVCTEK